MHTVHRKVVYPALACLLFFFSSCYLLSLRTQELSNKMKLAGTTVFASLLASVFGQTCQTTTLLTAPPTTNGTKIALGSYSYCAGVFNATAFVGNVDYNKVVSLYYLDGSGASTPLSVVTFGYTNGIGDGSTWELWSTSTPVFYDGLTKLLNLTFQATDIGATYTQVLNLPVNATGGPAPTVPALPKPYATPRGFEADITAWLAVAVGSELETAFAGMFTNINPAIDGASLGTVVAARSGPSYAQLLPDYEYNWVRDSSLTMDVVQMLYAAATKKGPRKQYETILFEYAMARAVEQIDPNLQTGLGEPKVPLRAVPSLHCVLIKS